MGVMSAYNEDDSNANRRVSKRFRTSRIYSQKSIDRLLDQRERG